MNSDPTSASSTTKYDPLPHLPLFGRLTALVALVLAVALPAGYFGLAYSARASALVTKAEVKAETINQVISQSPRMWRFEEARLRELLTRLPVELEDERAQVVSDRGEILAASHHEVPALAIVRSVPLFDAGAPVGHVEVRRSIHDLLLQTAGVAFAGCALAWGLLTMLLRLRASEKRGIDAFFAEQERARVTLHSIGDAVVTTGADERVEYMNPVAERLTQWTLEEARGRPVSEICSLIDESTMQAVPTPIARAVREDRVCPLSSEQVALMRRDGTALAIEDSAAPIHDRSGRVTGGAMIFRDVSATRRMAQRITWAATHDALTGLVNRREFESRVDAALVGAQNSKRQHVVLYLDLDQFKIVNDTCGHAAGDALLKALATVLQSKLRESDTLARLGGDEFGVLLEGCATDRAQLIANDLLAGVRDYRFLWDGKIFSIGVSIGLVAITAETTSRAEIFSTADAACYSAKEQGRNRVYVFKTSDVDIAQRRNEMGWAARLKAALEEDRFRLFYQPYMPLGQPGVDDKHFEVLLRLLDEDGTMVPPGSFLPAAERYDIMPSIDRWVIKTVFERYHDLVAQMGSPLTCAVNLSGTTLNSEGLLEFIQEQATMHELPPGAVCFEITETAAINNMRHATQFMRAAKASGFRFALDDFGVGTSSLAYLKTLPVDYLKIDGSFIRNIAHDPVDRAMADTINRVGHIMGLRTVGEYAESAEVIAELRTLGVDFAQGYGVERPQPLPAPLTSSCETGAADGSTSPEMEKSRA